MNQSLYSSDQPSDASLLRAWAQGRDQSAFSALLQRHLPLVMGTACRRLKRTDWAEEVTQQVFLRLADKAANINTSGGLHGWLHTATLLEAAKLHRTETQSTTEGNCSKNFWFPRASASRRRREET